MSELRDLDFDRLTQIFETGSKEELDQFCKENSLRIKDGKVIPNNFTEVKNAIEYWDKKQLVTKINLNSLYGALLNAGCRFFDQRIGQSTTLTGRLIARHMDAYINQAVTGIYDHTGEAIVYGDSVTGDTRIKTNDGEVTIEELFNQCQHTTLSPSGKEYRGGIDTKVIGFDGNELKPVMSEVSYVMRHKTKKKLYKITFSNDKTVTVTEDHSLIALRNGTLVEVTPLQVLETDVFISLLDK